MLHNSIFLLLLSTDTCNRRGAIELYIAKASGQSLLQNLEQLGWIFHWNLSNLDSKTLLWWFTSKLSNKQILVSSTGILAPLKTVFKHASGFCHSFNFTLAPRAVMPVSPVHYDEGFDQYKLWYNTSHPHQGLAVQAVTYHKAPAHCKSQGLPELKLPSIS